MSHYTNHDPARYSKITNKSVELVDDYTHIRLYSAVMKIPTLLLGDKVVYSHLYGLSLNDYGYAWPSIEEIMRECSISDGSAKNSIRKLIEQGFIQKIYQGGRKGRIQDTNKYRVKPPEFRLREKAPEVKTVDDAIDSESIISAEAQRQNQVIIFKALGKKLGLDPYELNQLLSNYNKTIAEQELFAAYRQDSVGEYVIDGESLFT